MSRYLHILLRLVGGVSFALLAACAHQPTTLYQWGSYQEQVYRHFQGEGPAKQIQDLEQDLQKMQSANRPAPPGFRAYLGMLYAEAGDDAKAHENLVAEQRQYPEAKPYIGLLLKKYQPKDASP